MVTVSRNTIMAYTVPLETTSLFDVMTLIVREPNY